MKKFLAILLVAVMATAMFAVPASAANKVVPHVATAPTIDGVKDAAYANALELTFASKMEGFGVNDTAGSLVVKAYALHDNVNLYLLLQVTGDTTVTKATTPGRDDGFQFFWFNPANQSGKKPPSSTMYYYRDTADDAYTWGGKLFDSAKKAETNGDWTLEIAMPMENADNAAWNLKTGNTVTLDIFYFDCNYVEGGTNTRNYGVALGGTKWDVTDDGDGYAPQDLALKLDLGTASTGSGTGTGTGSTNTGDNTVAFVGLALVSAIALAGVQLSKKRV